MQPKTQKIAALVADPSSHMTTLVAVMLRSIGIRQVDAAVDLANTAAALSRRSYGLVLIDDQLGGDAVADLVRTIRHDAAHPNRETPIIMMAAAPGAHTIARARDAGVTEFLRKPFSAEHIALRLGALRQAPRPFVEAGDFAGPDRRRRRDVSKTPRRRAGDAAEG